MRRLLTAALLLLLSAGPALAQRLSGLVVPEHYTLWFAPDLQNASFRGREAIDVTLKTPSREIMLHAAEIRFGEVTVTAGGRTQAARVVTDEARETATLLVPQAVPAGAATIAITYTGILNDKLRGFYLSEANNRRYAISQLEATDARRAFPSFDEPAFKATFDVTLMVDQGDTAISNGRPVSDVPGPEPGKHTVSFARTPKMSSYLVALLVGDFVCREGAADDIPVRVCSTPDKRAFTGFALDAAIQELSFYNRYFGIRYPFGKLDLIGVPDFAAGAMENTGAITFRETALLADPEAASLGTRKNVAATIAHEIAHQWFGDLVTMQWWDDVWLNEGFATWLANKPLAEWKPEWHVELDDVTATMAAKTTDTFRTTRPVRMDVESPAQINQVFDAIAYQKGAAVLRMVEHFVGPDLFRQGVSSYLRKYSYANATADDFWNEVARVTGKPVDRVMQTYIDQAGIPVVSPRASCTEGRTTVALTQERFLGTPGAPPPVAAQTWTVPVCLTRSADQAAQCELVTARSQTLTLAGACVATPFANAGSHGYYFTDYAPADARALARSAATSMTPADRLGFLGDEWFMTRSGRHDIDVYLDVAAALGTDPTVAVLQEIQQRLAYVGDYLVTPDQRPAFERWVRERFTPALEAIGIAGRATDDDDVQARRAALLSLVGIVGNSPDLQRRAGALALAYLDDPSTLPVGVAATILHIAALGGDAALYGRYLAQLELTGPAAPEAYYRYFNALVWFRDPALLTRTLDFALSDNVRTQDAAFLIGGALGQPWSRDAAWAFTQARWSTIAARLGTFQGIPGVVGSLQAFCSTERADEIRAFFMRNPVPTSNRLIQQSIERIEACAAIGARQRPSLTTWLAAAR